jgi:hypothetical protein
MHDEVEPRYVSYDEAVTTARAGALRDLHVTDHLISYVGRDECGDLSHCEFRYEPGSGWALWSRLLLSSERLPGEEITDAKIVELAAAGDQLRALRLYRTKYGAGLAEAVAGLKRLRGV